jgi:hypothetical protein
MLALLGRVVLSGSRPCLQLKMAIPAVVKDKITPDKTPVITDIRTKLTRLMHTGLVYEHKSHANTDNMKAIIMLREMLMPIFFVRPFENPFVDM